MLPSILYTAAKVEVAIIMANGLCKRGYIYTKNTLFDLDREMLPSVAYAATKFKVAAANDLGRDTLPRNRTHECTHTHMDRRADRL